MDFNDNVVEYNKVIKNEFIKKGGIDLLTKYVMSELLAPIEDFENAIKIIRCNYHLQISGELLIIGAHLISKWTRSKNEFLEILNVMYDYFPEKEKAIINYLNSFQIYNQDNNYINNKKYINELKRSIDYNTLFVYNYCNMAELVDVQEAKKYYEKALLNIERVYSQEEIEQLPLDHFLNPKYYIDEFILGTNLSFVNYDIIMEKYNLIK